MDFQRIILIGIIAITSYLIVLQWQQDYGNNGQPVSEVASTKPETSPDLPTLSTPGSSKAEDIPTSPAATTADTTAASKDKMVATAGKLIQVKSDELELLIDPHGGDIIHAELNNYLARLGAPDKFVLLENTGKRSYVAQSGLTGKDGPDAAGSRPQYQSKALSYQMANGQNELQVDLTLQQDNGVTITKRFTLTRGKYVVKVDYLVQNNSDKPWQASLFGQLKRDDTEDPTAQHSMGMRSYLGPAFSSSETPYKKVSFKDIKEHKYSNKTEGGWVAMLQHYFVSAWIPNAKQTNNYFARENNGNYFAGFVAPSLSLAPGEKGSVGAELYVGPKVEDSLAAAAPHLELTVDLGWLWWIALPLFHVINWIHGVVGNWGVAIILVTVCIKLLFFYPSAIAYRSMAKMRAMGPEMQRLKELYGDDRQKLSQSMMELYKKEKINPLGGCLPMLIQMPVFISLYWVLKESVELRHAPFFLWIHDLSVMDPYFVLPILMGATMLVQQFLNPTPPDPMQAKVMKMLPFIFTIFFLWFPAGLVLYWVVNNMLSITQQWIITKQIEASTQAKKR